MESSLETITNKILTLSANSGEKYRALSIKNSNSLFNIYQKQRFLSRPINCVLFFSSFCFTKILMVLAEKDGIVCRE